MRFGGRPLTLAFAAGSFAVVGGAHAPAMVVTMAASA